MENICSKKMLRISIYDKMYCIFNYTLELYGLYVIHIKCKLLLNKNMHLDTFKNYLKIIIIETVIFVLELTYDSTCE